MNHKSACDTFFPFFLIKLNCFRKYFIEYSLFVIILAEKEQILIEE